MLHAQVVLHEHKFHEEQRERSKIEDEAHIDQSAGRVNKSSEFMEARSIHKFDFVLSLSLAKIVFLLWEFFHKFLPKK